jgi:cytochrome bd-type quinol oxidase subunit 2
MVIDGTIDEVNILIYLGMFYLSLMCFLSGLYMRSMYVQYKNAHDKWYDINKEVWVRS